MQLLRDVYVAIIVLRSMILSQKSQDLHTQNILYSVKFLCGKIFVNGLKVKFCEKYYCEFGEFG